MSEVGLATGTHMNSELIHLASSETRAEGMGEPVPHTLCTQGRKLSYGSDVPLTFSPTPSKHTQATAQWDPSNELNH